MTVFRMYMDKDKETEWLNRMAQDGYAMVSFFCGFYKFVPCEKGEWQYQIDIGHGFFNVKKNYSEFMEEMDIEIVQSWGPWVIMRRKTRDCEFSLYSDIDSRTAQYKKILLMYKIAIVIEIMILIFDLYCAFKGIAWAWPCSCVIAAIVFAFINMIIRTKNTITDLEEQKGEPQMSARGRNISPAIPAGFLINAINLLSSNIPGITFPNPVRVVLLGFSVGLIIYGAAVTAIRHK